MAFRRVVVDGSNIATEGRSVPSLSQLDEAVREFQREFPDAEITVVVDASFGHRIEQSERPAFEEAEAHGEIVSPPAGAIGRGDAFLLRIAEKTGATVLSNDSFQEFHGEHDWLFSESRLIGGKPVPGVGWIFTPRTPVRGPRSRVATKDPKRSRVRIGSREASQPMPVPSAPPPGRAAGDRSGPQPAGAGAALKDGAIKEAAPRDKKVRQAIAAATEEVVAPQSTPSGRKRRRRGSGPPAQAVNDPLTFITFIAEHHLGEEVIGEIETFTSHGAFVRIGEAQAYLPVSGLGDPPPASARRVVKRGEQRAFVVQALDPQRRGVELSLPEFARVAGSPSEETVEAEISEVAGDRDGPSADAQAGEAPSRKARASKKDGASKKARGAAKGAASKKDTAVAREAGEPDALSGEPGDRVEAADGPAGGRADARARKAARPSRKAAAPGKKTAASAKKTAASAKKAAPPAKKAKAAPKKAKAVAKQATARAKEPAKATRKTAKRAKEPAEKAGKRGAAGRTTDTGSPAKSASRTTSGR